MEYFGLVIVVNNNIRQFISFNKGSGHFYKVDKSSPMVKQTEGEINTVKKILEEDKKFLKDNGITKLSVRKLYLI